MLFAAAFAFAVLSFIGGASSLLTLRDISFSSAALSSPFAATTLAYGASIPQRVSAIDITAVSSSATSFISVRVNDGPFQHADSARPRTLTLSAGLNSVFVTNAREDGAGGLTYLVTILNGGIIASANDTSADVRLVSLQLPHFALTPAFSWSHATYTAETLVSAAHTHSLTVLPFTTKVTAAAAAGHGAVEIHASLNGDMMYPLRSGTSSGRMALRKGTNVLFVQTSALSADSSSAMIRTYSIFIKRTVQSVPVQRDRRSIEFIGGSTAAAATADSQQLTALTTSAGLIKPQFAPDTIAYTLAVDFHVPIIQFTAVPKSAGAAMTLHYPSANTEPSSLFSLPLSPSRPSPFIPLAEGANVISIAVGSKLDSAQRTVYTITVTRERREVELSADDAHGHIHQHNGGTPAAATSNQSAARAFDGVRGKHRFAAPFNHIAKRSSSPHDDPVVVGLYGQRYSIHVEPGFVYNLLTSPHIQLNARYIDSADIGGRGIGIGELGIRTKSGEELYVAAGTAGRGFSRVALNDRTINVGEFVEITEAPSEEESAGHRDGHGEGHEHTTDKIHFNSSNKLLVTTATFAIALTAQTDGINVRISLTTPLTLEAHGLIGQTWRSKREHLHQHSGAAAAAAAMSAVDSDESEEGEEDSMEHVEGAMADYRLRDGGLFSEAFQFNLYESADDEADDDDDDDRIAPETALRG